MNVILTNNFKSHLEQDALIIHEHIKYLHIYANTHADCTEELFSDSRVKIQNYIFRVHFIEEGGLVKVFRKEYCKEGKPLVIFFRLKGNREN